MPLSAQKKNSRRMVSPTSSSYKLLESFALLFLGCGALVAGHTAVDSLPSVTESQGQPQPSANQVPVEAISGYRCNTQVDVGIIEIDYENCKPALEAMRQTAEYKSGKSSWIQDHPFTWGRWGKLEDGCIIAVGCRFPNTLGHFTLRDDVEEAFYRVKDDCSATGLGGNEFFLTDDVKHFYSGWSAAFYNARRVSTLEDVDGLLFNHTEVAQNFVPVI